MGYVLFAVAAYIFMRAFEVFCAEWKGEGWYRLVSRVIAVGVLYAALAGMLIFYWKGLHLLGFDPS
ncbi:MAG: hypothetical protein WC789_12925 [Lentisphaeria bacterium]|jgi:hypothetical protein